MNTTDKHNESLRQRLTEIFFQENDSKEEGCGCGSGCVCHSSEETEVETCDCDCNEDSCCKN